MLMFSRFRRTIAAAAVTATLATATATPVTADPLSDLAISGLSVGSAGLGSTAGSMIVTLAIPYLVLVLLVNTAVTSGSIAGEPLVIPEIPPLPEVPPLPELSS